MTKMPQPQPTPKAPDPIRVPRVDDPDVELARRKKMGDEFGQRRGRESTNLVGDAAPNYSRTTLG